MDGLTFFFLIAGGYCVLLFFDVFFKSCCHYPYLQLLENLGINISYFTIKWKTKALNRLIIKWGNARPQFWKVWFSIGTFTSLAFLPISIYIIFISIYWLFFNSTSQVSEPLISPVVPGLNLPVSELGYYSIALLICSIVHELGHALAAVIEDVGTLELGCNVYFILPVAFVSLPTDKLYAINHKKRLGIVSAGVWHNIVLSFIAYLLYCSLPTIFSPLYNYGDSVSVSGVNKNSPLNDPTKGLSVDDIIIAINNCDILNENYWYHCLHDRYVLRPAVCIKSDLVNTLDESVPLKHLGSGYVECCDPKNSKNICFEYIDNETNELELPGHVCLPGRTVMEQSANFCTKSPHSCPSDSYCFQPVLPNDTYLFKIITNTKNIIYLGNPNDLFQTMDISSYVKKTNLFSVSFPEKVTKLVKYIVVISLGLAFVNILPFAFMDGEYILQTLALIIFTNIVDKKKIVQTVNVITWISTIILIVYLVYSLFLLL
ncbi:unnamed protein product [Ceutorhynchus assimilis]|uniref:Membrane-bound transcription factor site-2 protease n=1 Tax=Ceutorhynchus assimilis TaxID=467358 RepID=A0A9N9QQA0_9CUCU|nr:unnamed protein product [Ceutorhynchus assimilis]